MSSFEKNTSEKLTAYSYNRARIKRSRPTVRVRIFSGNIFTLFPYSFPLPFPLFLFSSFLSFFLFFLRFFDSRKTIKSEGIKRLLEHREDRSIERGGWPIGRLCFYVFFRVRHNIPSFISASTGVNGRFVVKKRVFAAMRRFLARY